MLLYPDFRRKGLDFFDIQIETGALFSDKMVTSGSRACISREIGHFTFNSIFVANAFHGVIYGHRKRPGKGKWKRVCGGHLCAGYRR